MPKTVKACVEKMFNLFEKECKKMKKDDKHKLDSAAIEKIIVKTAPLKRGAINPDAKKKKRPLSGYMKFAQSIRPKIVAENPNFAVTDVMKKIGKEWGKLTDTEKEKWNKK